MLSNMKVTDLTGTLPSVDEYGGPSKYLMLSPNKIPTENSDAKSIASKSVASSKRSKFMKGGKMQTTNVEDIVR